jgi:hypothetical protein
MSKFFDRLRRFFQGESAASGEVSPAPENSGQIVDENSIKDLMQRIEQTNEGEYSCAETFALLDEYVELVAGGEDVELLMPLVKKHVEHCPDCGPRFEILLDILENS